MKLGEPIYVFGIISPGGKGNGNLMYHAPPSQVPGVVSPTMQDTSVVPTVSGETAVNCLPCETNALKLLIVELSLFLATFRSTDTIINTSSVP